MTPTTDRTIINRINSKHSTGPKTKAGKHRSSQNALQHGLTAQSAVLPTDDQPAYHRHVQSFVTAYNPDGPTEVHLVQTLADTAWRQDRIAALEARLIAADHLDTRAISNLSLHSQRLARQFEKALLLLKEVQTPRLQAGQRDLERAADLIEMHELKEEPYDPTEDGFVFSKPEIDAFRALRNRNDRALLASDYLNADDEDED
jgi:hypothetical protein